MTTCPNCGKAYKPGDEVCPSCGLVFPFTTDTLVPGTVLQNRYEIERLYHSGGMGYVYLALDKKLYDRSCIVKQVKEPVRSEANQMKLEEEALRMSRLNHSGIAMILDHFIENGYYYLVVERIQGKTLSEVFDEKHGKLAEGEVVKWAVAMCEVLEYIHKEGVIHRDISPDNVILTEDGHIKFIDFGTLREFRHIAVQGTAGMGKYGYTPPEQWQGKPVAQSDIFALGATIYYLLSGNLPLSKEYKSGQGPQKTDFRPEFPSIRTKNPDVSPQLGAVLQNALQLDVNARFSSAVEMGQALRSAEIVEKERSLKILPATKEAKVQLPTNRAEQVKKTQEKPIPAISAAINSTSPKHFSGKHWTILATIALIVVISILGIRSLVNQPPPVSETTHIHEPQGTPILGDQPSRTEKIAYIDDTLRYEDTSESDLYVMDVDGSNQLLLAKDTMESGDPAWSPDGERIAFYSESTNTIDIIDKNGRNRKTIAGGIHPTWSPDGTMIAFATTGLSVVNLVTSEKREIYRVGSSTSAVVSDPSWSPDGKRIVFNFHHNGYCEIYVVNVDGSHIRKLVSEKIPETHWWIGPLWSPDSAKIAFVLWTGQIQTAEERSELQLINADGSGRIKLTEADPSGGLSWSPDGTRLAFLGGKSSYGICTINIDGSNFKRLTVGSDDPAWSPGGRDPTWSPDGKRIAFAADGIYIMDSDGNNKKRLTTGEYRRQYNPVWSPR